MVFSDADHIQTHLVGVGDLVQQVAETLGGVALFAGHGVWGRRDKIVQNRFARRHHAPALSHSARTMVAAIVTQYDRLAMDRTGDSKAFPTEGSEGNQGEGRKLMQKPGLEIKAEPRSRKTADRFENVVGWASRPP